MARETFNLIEFFSFQELLAQSMTCTSKSWSY